MLHQVIVGFEEILAEMGHEYVTYPVRMIAEAVQFALLAAIVWVVAMGWGKRKGFVANMLSERAERVDKEIELSSHAEADLASAEQAASERLDTADADAGTLVAAAEEEARTLESTAREQADAEARRTVERANSALETERDEMRSELREELVSIVAQATRSILSEKMSVAEQRAAIEGAIVASVSCAASAEEPSAPAPKARAQTAAASGAAS